MSTLSTPEEIVPPVRRDLPLSLRLAAGTVGQAAAGIAGATLAGAWPRVSARWWELAGFGLPHSEPRA
jgi:hypothetical protein